METGWNGREMRGNGRRREGKLEWFGYMVGGSSTGGAACKFQGNREKEAVGSFCIPKSFVSRFQLKPGADAWRCGQLWRWPGAA